MTLVNEMIIAKSREMAVRRALVPPTSASSGFAELIELVVKMFECRDDLLDATEAWEEDHHEVMLEFKDAAEKAYADVLKELREAVGV